MSSGALTPPLLHSLNSPLTHSLTHSLTIAHYYTKRMMSTQVLVVLVVAVVVVVVDAGMLDYFAPSVRATERYERASEWDPSDYGVDVSFPIHSFKNVSE